MTGGVIKPSGACRSCIKENLKCDKGKPHCKNCQLRGINCSYFMELKWGGRPYKDKNKRIKMPKNTKMVDGILVPKRRQPKENRPLNKIENFIFLDGGAVLSKNKKKIASVDSNSKHLSYPFKMANAYEIADSTSIENKSSSDLIQQLNDNKSLPDNHFLSDLLLSGTLGTLHSISLCFSGTPVFMNTASQYSELFSFFVHETSKMFVISSAGPTSNPHATNLPRLALSCPTVMKLLIVFGSRHKMWLSIRNEENTGFYPLEDMSLPRTDYEKIAEDLLAETLFDLKKKLLSPGERFSYQTLAILLLLISLSVFFGDQQLKWRTHLFGARNILMNHKKKMHEVNTAELFRYNTGLGTNLFLQRWFTYINVVSILSSADFPMLSDSFLEVDFGSQTIDSDVLEHSMKNLDDIQHTIGMDLSVLSYLSGISRIMIENSRIRASANEALHSAKLENLLTRSFELDYNFREYLTRSERKRDYILKAYFTNESTSIDAHVKSYSFVRLTNLVWGLTGLLLLRRRIMQIPQDSTMVKDIISQLTNLLYRNDLSVDLPTQPCLLFNIFCYGCELMDPSSVSLRTFCQEYLRSLRNKGVASAHDAMMLMEDCWSSNKSWWEILKDKNLDLCFAL